MKDKLGGILGSLPFRPPDQGAAQDPDQQAVDQFRMLVEKARAEWLAARSLFDSVSDPALVDHAIHLIVAAEKKYDYLLRQAKAEGIHVEPL